MTLDCDTRHEILAPTNHGYDFVKFSDLKEGDPVCLSYPQEHEFGEYPGARFFSGGEAHNSVDVTIATESDWNFMAYVLGTVVGDGNVREGTRHSITVCFGSEKAFKNYGFIKSGFAALGLKLSPLSRTKGSKGVAYRADVSSKALVEAFKYLGYTGEDARTKRVPEAIFRAPLMMRKAFLKGYHDTDGCKKEANGYCFHTPNCALLRDVQRVAWTLGIPSVVRPNADGTFVLSWCDLSAIERMLGIKTRVRKRCTSSDVLLPDFLHREVYEMLKSDSRYSKDNRDRALVCKLNKGKKLLLTTAVALLKKYGCRIPTIYYTATVSKKIINNAPMDTYTLSVDSPLHRFDSEGVISKNTGADVIKIALYRIWKWIKDNGYGDDVHMLMPIHDEIVFEVKEDKLDFYVPELCEILRIKDLIEALGWPVPLEVDAEYGDSFHVDHDYEFGGANADKAVPAQTTQAQPPETQVPKVVVQTSATDVAAKEVPMSESPKAPVPSVGAPVTVLETPMGQSAYTTNSGESIHFTITVREAVMAAAEKARLKFEVSESEAFDEALKDVRVKDRIDHRGVLVYPIERLDHITLHQFDTAIRILVNFGDALFIGPKCKVALVDKSTGDVWYESTRKVSVDAFLALCFWLKI